MSNNLKIFLKALTKTGYPNPNVHSVAKLVGYDLDNFLPDLEKELGEEGVVDFCKKGLDKLQGQEGIRVELEGPYDEFVYVKIKPKYYDERESQYDIISDSEWGESKILWYDSNGENEEFKSIEDVIDDVDMGDWGDLDELIDSIKNKAYNIVRQNCGFGIWWE